MVAPADLYSEYLMAVPADLYSEYLMAVPAELYSEYLMAAPADQYSEYRMAAPADLYSEYLMDAPADLYSEYRISAPADLYSEYLMAVLCCCRYGCHEWAAVIVEVRGVIIFVQHSQEDPHFVELQPLCPTGRVGDGLVSRSSSDTGGGEQADVLALRDNLQRKLRYFEILHPECLLCSLIKKLITIYIYSLKYKQITIQTNHHTN